MENPSFSLSTPLPTPRPRATATRASFRLPPFPRLTRALDRVLWTRIGSGSAPAERAERCVIIHFFFSLDLSHQENWSPHPPPREESEPLGSSPCISRSQTHFHIQTPDYDRRLRTRAHADLDFAEKEWRNVL